jgi:uncharacterized Fe-S radical SAM superfamily protein PflX
MPNGSSMLMKGPAQKILEEVQNSMNGKSLKRRTAAEITNTLELQNSSIRIVQQNISYKKLCEVECRMDSRLLRRKSKTVAALK